MKKLTADGLLSELRLHVDPEKCDVLPTFFKAFPGGYGEGDRFLGVVVPEQRKIARKFAELSKSEMRKALRSPWHESRLTALFVLVHQYGKTRASERDEHLKFYLEHLDYVNNWDLVDSSAGQIVGTAVLDGLRSNAILYSLAASKHLWRERVSVVATMPLIKAGRFAEILKLAKQFLDHPHDLIHKAVGWMLREVGKKDESTLKSFLETHSAKMPRTMLRYSIERSSQSERKHFMSR